LPPTVFLPFIRHVKAPVFFAHPWEFVDMSATQIRPDCKFNPGEKALRNLKTLIRASKAENCLFLTMEERASLEKL
jgi:hypothetical protein